MKTPLREREVNKRYPKPTFRRKVIYKIRMLISIIITNTKTKKLRAVNYRIIISPGRTGTRVLGLKLNNYGLLSRHEPRPAILDLAIKYQSKKLNSKRVFSAFLKRRALYMNDSINKNQIFIESNHTLTFLLELILQKIPETKAVFITRDPVNYVRSAYSKVHGTKHMFNKHRFLDEDDKRQRVTTTTLKKYPGVNWDKLSRFEKICWNYRMYHDEYLLLLDKGFDIPLYKFEELFSSEEIFKNFMFDLNTNLTLSQISALNTSVTEKQINSTKKDELGSFSNWKEEHKVSFEQIIGPIKKNFGY